MRYIYAIFKNGKWIEVPYSVYKDYDGPKKKWP